MTTRSVHLTPTCDWGGCNRIDIRPIAHQDATWLLCPPHVAEHYSVYPIERGNRPRPLVKGVLPCGTPAAYNRHIRYGQVPCDPCREAMRKKSRDRKNRAKAKADEWNAMKDGAA